jgi:hypothetical protein
VFSVVDNNPRNAVVLQAYESLKRTFYGVAQSARRLEAKGVGVVKRRVSVSAWVLATGVLFCTASGYAGVPSKMLFKGALPKKVDGNRLPARGDVEMSFGIYADADGGVSLWSETQTLTLGKNRSYEVTLGRFIPLDPSLFENGAELWVGVMVKVPGKGGSMVEFEIHPRQAMLPTSVYCFKAQYAETLTSVSALENRVAQLETLLQNVMREGDDIKFKGVNVHILNGEGSTFEANGLGNLIVGYNEPRPTGTARSGSHNIVVGAYNEYSSYGGLVAGYWNTISEGFATVSGGYSNTASGRYSSVSGGAGNNALAILSSVSGGFQNTSRAWAASISGGAGNSASGSNSSISGGEFNTASGGAASVTGGRNNLASSQASTVSGGGDNVADQDGSCVSGGSGNFASGPYSCVGGGNLRAVTGAFDWQAGQLFQEE